MIEVQNLSKSFQGFQALDKVSFCAPDGQVTGLIGPNGAGKTTSLRIIYTVMNPDSGAALVDGYNSVEDRVEVQRRLGVLADNRGLYPRLTAREHVRYFARLQGMRGKELEASIDRMIKALGMEDIADRRAKGFSKGQTMKVSLARALAHRPQNILLDEPTNGLDIASARAVRQLIRDLRNEGKAVLFSSHIMQEVTAICDRLVVLSRGRVIAEGTQQELREMTGQQDLEEAFIHIVGREAEETFFSAEALNNVA
ncbi:MAG: ATP-binding cassette domain-containing protein [Magnetospiraceae bacterium]